MADQPSIFADLDRKAEADEAYKAAPDSLFARLDKASAEGITLDTAAPVGSSGFVGGLADFGRGVARGVVHGLPEQVGKAAQFFGAEDTGRALQGFAKGTDYPALRQSQVGQIANAESVLSPRGAAASAGENTPLSVGPGIAGALAGGALGSVVPGIGTIAGAAGGYIAGSLAALPIFYGSQGQETAEKVEKAQLAAGATPETAASEARTAGHISGAIESGGEILADLIPFSKLLKPFAKPVQGAVVKGLFGGGLKDAAKTVGQVIGGEVSTEMAQTAAEAAVEGAYGAGEGATWKDTASVIMPTVLMSLLPGGFTAAHNYRSREQIRKTLGDAEADPEQRIAAAATVFSGIEDKDPRLAVAFEKYARDQILAGKPIEIGEDALYERHAVGLPPQETPAEKAGLDPTAGPASAAAAAAVNTGLSDAIAAQRQQPIDDAALTKREEELRAEDPDTDDDTIAEQLATEQADQQDQQDQQPAPGGPMFPFKTIESAQAHADVQTKRGTPSVVIPHPIKSGHFAVREDLTPEQRRAQQDEAYQAAREAQRVEREAKMAARDKAKAERAAQRAQPQEQSDAGLPPASQEEAPPTVRPGENVGDHPQDAAGPREGTDAEEAAVAPPRAALPSFRAVEAALERARPSVPDGTTLQKGESVNQPSLQKTESVNQSAPTTSDADTASAKVQPAALPAFRDVEKGLAKRAELPTTTAPGDTASAKVQAVAAPLALPAPAHPTDVAAHEAASSPTNDLAEPTAAQALAGNYKKGHLRVGPLDISVENPEGSTRSDKENTPPKWSRTIERAHYGYIKGTLGRDKDHIDAFVKPGTDEQHDGPVFVIDQVGKDGAFDEHKVMVGYPNRMEAIGAYKDNYPKGHKVGAVTETSMRDFETWSRDTYLTSKPFAEREQATAAAIQQEVAPTTTQTSPTASATTVVDGKLHTDLPTVQHVTTKGKTLTGVVWKAPSLFAAKAIDKFTFKKDGGYFIREQHVARDAAPTTEPETTKTKKVQPAAETTAAPVPKPVTPQIAAPVGSTPLGAKAKPAYGDSNKVFTSDAADKARELLRKKFGQVSSGIDPELMQAGLTLAGYHIEAGARKFIDYAEKMLEDLGDMVRPYLKSWYVAIYFDPRIDNAGMDGPGTVESTNLPAPAEGSTIEPQSPKEGENEPAILGSYGPETLGDVASQKDGGAQGSGRVERSDAGSGTRGDARDRVPDEAGVSTPRGRGSRPAQTDSVDARAGSQSTDVGKGRARGARKAARQDNGSLDLEAPPAAPNITAQNFRITDEVRLGQGGEAEKFRDNVAAIRALKAIEADNRRATPEEQRILARYVGWGGLSNAFNDPSTGKFKDGWGDRGQELADLLTPSEASRARRSTMDAHYTSETVVNGMWKAAEQLGYKGGIALESSMGMGNFLGLIPESLLGSTKFIGVEYDSLTARMAAHLYPQSTVLNIGFHKLPMPDNAVDLNIGNPPFGKQSLRFQYKPELHGKSIHNQFFIAGLDAVKPGGLQINVVSRYLMDAQDSASRAELAKRAKLLGVIRLPDTAFKENARTEVVTDIVFLQKLTESEQAEMRSAFEASNEKPGKDYRKEAERQRLAAKIPSWVETTTVPDPQGGEDIRVNTYFAAHPEMVLGTLDRSGSMQFKNDVTVRLPKGADMGKLLDEAITRLPSDVMTQAHDAIAASHERYTSMAEALKIAARGEEPGSLAVDADGKMRQVFERETPEGGYELARREILPTSPWSDQLLQNKDGKWYRLVQIMDDKGKPAKVMKDGKPTKRNLYTREVFDSVADVPAGLRLGDKNHAILRDLVGLRDLFLNQVIAESEDASPKEIEANRKKLAAAYDAFVAEHGFVSRYAKLVSTMPDAGRVLALEVEYYPEITKERAAKMGEKPRPESAVPAPIMKQRVLHKYAPPTTAKSPADALIIALAESGRVDIERIASLLGKTQEEAEAALYGDMEKPLIFKDPEKQAWVTRDEYLSGQVRRKLEAAKATGNAKNIAALEAVQPEAWGAENVTVNIGATWVPPQVYTDFLEHLTGSPVAVRFAKATNSFAVAQGDSQSEKAREWGTGRMSATDIVADMLNSRAIKVIDVDSDGGRHVNHEETNLALLKAKEIGNAFSDWVFADGDRRRMLTGLFNDKYNTRVNRQHDGSHLTLPGKVPDEIIKMRKHQKNAIWRGISERFMLADHAVGSGKTFTSIARAMERRRMGLARKPTIVVPNHMVEQFSQDVYRLYPGAKVLAAGKADFERAKRRRLFGRIASGDWDVVILPHSSFAFIGIAPETEERYLQAELLVAEQAVDEAWEDAGETPSANGKGRKPFNVKAAERLREKIETRLDAVRMKKRDNLLTFEQMGIDDLTIDEAHEFKNLFYSSSLSDVRGMGNRIGSQKAADLYNKVRVLRESPTGAVTFLSGTPISNSAVEMYSIMRYLAADELADMGLEHFDAWRAQFVNVDTAWEPTESGRLKEVNRMGRSWTNMRSLMDTYYSFTDAVTNDDIKKVYAQENNGAEFPLPRVAGGGRQLVKVPATPAQVDVLESVIRGFDSLPNIPDPYERNKERLRLMDRARKVSLDVRAVLPQSDSKEEGGKLDVMADKITEIAKKWKGDKGTQLVFLDRGVPRAKGDDALIKEYDGLVAERDAALASGDEAAYQEIADRLEKFDANEMAEVKAAQKGGWTAYQQLKDNLVARGMPAREIRFVQEANNDAQKQALFDAVNAGDVRVLIGSTQRMGAGTNVQKRIVAVHHGDVTWKPSDIEQREGRGIRQGNDLLDKYGIDKFLLEIYAYATERSVEAKMWDLNATKLKMVNGIRRYDGAFNMDFDDQDSVSMAEMAALASGDPMLLERVKTASEIDSLELLERDHRRKMHGYKDAIDDAKRAIKDLPAKIESATSMAEEVAERRNTLQKEARERSLTVNGVKHSTAFAAMSAATASIREQQGDNDKARYEVEVGGKRLTSKDSIGSAIDDALGDHEPFDMKIGDATYLGRTDAGRKLGVEARKVAQDLGDGEIAAIKPGVTMLGYPVSVEVEKHRWGYVASMEIKGKNGKQLRRARTNTFDKWASFDTQVMSRLVREFDALINANSMRSEAAWAEKRVKQAKAELPELEEKVKVPFAKAEQLAAARERLQRIISGLAGTPTSGSTAEAASRVMGRDAWEWEGGRVGAEDGATMYSLDEAPLWRSALTEALPKAPWSKAGDIDAAQLAKWLEARGRDGTFKADELAWSGLTDWLALQTRVTRDQVTAFFDANGVKVTETILGGEQEDAARSDEIDRLAREFAEDNGGWDAQTPQTQQELRAEAEASLGIEDLADASRGYHRGSKFSAYQMPGGENYRELLLTLPGKTRVEKNAPDDYAVFDSAGTLIADGVRESEIAGVRAEGRGADFHSPHFDQPNILAHVRFNERTDASGNKVLFIEEIQSDWAQKGRKHAFVAPEAAHRFENPVPAAPFVGKTEAWVALAMKRMIRYAADNGFDSIAWTTGEQQAERYDLSKRIDEVTATPVSGGYHLTVTDKNGATVTDRRYDTAQLPDVVGKELAEKIVQNEGEKLVDIRGENPEYVYRGLDLKVGGGGMRAFYDKIVPNVANDILKKMGGGRVEHVSILTEPLATDSPDATEITDDGEVPRAQPGFAITPKMRELAGQGMPLFKQGDTVASGMRAVDVQKVIAPIIRLWRNAPKIRVVQSAPAGIPANARGYFQGGMVTLIADRLRDARDAQFVLLHEVVGHAGLRGVLGNRLEQLMDRIYRSNPEIRRMADARIEHAQRTAGLTYSRALATEEALADMAGQGRFSEVTGWKWLVAAIRSALRTLGFDLSFNDAEVAALLAKSKEYIENRNSTAKSSAKDISPKFSLDRTFRTAFDRYAAYGQEPASGRDGVLEAMNIVGMKAPFLNVTVKDGPPSMGDDVPMRFRPADRAVEINQSYEFTKAEAVQAGVEELMHALDVTTDGLSVAGNSARFAKDGDLRREIEKHWRDGGPYAAYYEYPLHDRYGFDDNRIAAELFARAGALYFGEPARMQAQLPATHEVFDGLFALREHPDRQSVSRKIRPGAGEHRQAGGEPGTQPLAGRGMRGGAGDGRASGLVQLRSDIARALGATRFGTTSVGDSLETRSVESLADRATHLASDLFSSPRQFNSVLKHFQTQYHKAQTNRWFRPVFDAAQNFVKDTSRFATEAADQALDLLPKLGSIGDWFKRGPKEADVRAAGRAMFAATLADIRPSESDLAAGMSLRSPFGPIDVPPLTATQIGLFNEARAAIDTSLRAVAASEMVKLARGEGIDEAIGLAIQNTDEAHAIIAEALRAIEPVNESAAAAREALIEKIDAVHDRVESLLAKGYAPLQRFGTYTVHVTKMVDGERQQLYFGMYESRLAMNRAAREFSQDPEFEGATVTAGVMDRESYKLFQGLALDELATYAEITGMDQDEAFQDYYKLALSNNSALKRLIHRKGIAGYDEDLRRVLASFITSNARLAARNIHFGEMLAAATRIPVEHGDVREEAAKLVTYMRNPTEEAASFRGLLFVNFIGGSVASALVNMTQPVMMTLPFLSQFTSPTKALGLLTQAAKYAGGAVPEDAVLREAMERASKEGITDPQEIHQLYAESIRGLGSSIAWRKALSVWGKPFALAESWNRQITFAAAFQAARDPAALHRANEIRAARGLPVYADAFAFAAGAVEDTQGIYNRANRPNLARGAIGASVFTFKQFSIAYLEFLSRLPAREKALAGALLFLATGLQGAPGADDLEDLIDTIGQMMGYNTNTRQALRRGAAHILGESMGGFVSHGISAIPGVPLDIQARMSLGNLIPGSGLFKRSETAKEREIAEAIGPAGGLYNQAMGGFNALVAGNPLAAAGAAAPVALRNLAQGVTMWNTGQYRDTHGRKVMDVDGMDAAFKSLGFQPQEVAQVQRRASDIQQDVTMARKVESEIADRWVRGIIDHDPDAVQSAVRDLFQWNQRNPDSRIAIMPAQIRQRVEQAMMSREVRMLKSAPRELRSGVFDALRNP